MMRLPHPAAAGLRLGHACQLAARAPRALPANRPPLTLTLVALHHQGPRPSPRAAPLWPAAARSLTTSQPCPKRAQESPAQSRFSRASPTYHPPRLDPDAVSDAVNRIISTLNATSPIPSEEATLTALRAVAQFDVRRPSPPRGAGRPRPDADQLLGLDGAAASPGSPAHAQHSAAAQLDDVIDILSDAAYTIVTEPAVVITRDVLGEYITLQARLGRPESLPQILDLYKVKPKPKLVSGAVVYAERNPDKADSAVDPTLAAAALDAAIEAKDMEAALSVVEHTYATTAHVRSKLLKTAFLPATVLVATPPAIYYGAAELARYQNALDPKLATAVAFVGTLCYVGFTATIGLVAHLTANDHMKRITWAEGTPLRHRWLYEDERAALDKIACSFGFAEAGQYGEEDSSDFKWLREYALIRSMILDSVALMPGMN
ncbi:hypothetical protein C8A05DRAFT_48437 [Staphylotrichum tortipilum]|uniref:Uncharacterized protein n=1 Tax=Staphylotrichum tortipilum TaxID=2831512 RepID=A0AAN6MAQ8_9PEZI|nr:hypothetical protein C8A05DRAFT_48437 [Staphylotrichum longicolle]